MWKPILHRSRGRRTSNSRSCPPRCRSRPIRTCCAALVQNLVSNAIKYTISGKVIVGARRRGGEVVIDVMDFRHRHPPLEVQDGVQGVRPAGRRGTHGLRPWPCLSIVDRISRVLSHPVELASTRPRHDIPEGKPRDAGAAVTKTIRCDRKGGPAAALGAARAVHTTTNRRSSTAWALLLSGWLLLGPSGPDIQLRPSRR